MKKIVKGNDFTLRVPVMRIVDGEQVAFPLPACTDIQVNVANAYRRVPLAYTIDVANDNVLLARVEGDTIALGTYALEVKGKLFGNDWRSNEYEQFQIVNNNASADTELGGTEEGEESVEMDTALVILAPSDELTSLIKDANTAIGTVRQLDTTLTANEEARATAEQERVNAEQAREQAEKVRAEAETARAKADQDRSANENARKAAEVKRESDLSEAISDAQDKMQGAVAKCETDTKAATDKVKADCQAAITAMNGNADTTITELNKAKEKAVADCEQAAKDALVAVDYDPDTYSIIIKTGKEE